MLFRLAVVLVSVLVAVPSINAISCYHCSDIGTTDFEHPLLRAAGASFAPPCENFDEDDDQFKIRECVGGFTTSCAKATINGKLIRGCYDQSQEPGCKTSDQLSVCVCTEDYCNGGVTATMSTILLLLPAAIIARIFMV